MKTLNARRAAALFGLVALAACDTGTPTEALLDDITPDEALELAVVADGDAVDAALEVAASTGDVALARADAGAQEGRDLAAQARARFADAQEALRQGDPRKALDEAREARRLIARALHAVGGIEAIVSRIERLEALALTATEDPDAFDDPAAARAELGNIADAARDALARADTIGAGARAILGEQRAHQWRRHFDRPGDVFPARARLRVALATTAVALAERLVAAQDAPNDVQHRYLAVANKLLDLAERALAAGRFGRAVHFAELASWSALKAVVLPGGVTTEEARAMHDLAVSLLDEARAAIGEDPTEVQQALLGRAGRLIELGEAQLARGNMRGVGALWRSAVISSWLIR